MGHAVKTISFFQLFVEGPQLETLLHKSDDVILSGHAAALANISQGHLMGACLRVNGSSTLFTPPAAPEETLRLLGYLRPGSTEKVAAEMKAARSR